MKTNFEVAKKEFSFSLDNARVIHANKFTEASGGWGSLPINSTLYTDVVFRSQESGADWPIRFNNRDLPLYTDQEVMVMSIDQYIIGFIDKQTSKYYYTETDFAYLLDLGFPLFKAVIAGIVLGVLGYFISSEMKYRVLFCIAPLFIAWVSYLAKKWQINREITSKLDDYLRET
ncbi:MAG: hypothetical protein V4450_09030 [Bacteroidota bacterium]